MDILYIPQLEDYAGAGETAGAGRYRLLRRVPESGTVILTDRAVTRVEVASSDPLRVVLPPLVKGAVRDFFARLVVTSESVPEVTFAAPDGETVSFEDASEEALRCELGVNVFAFTETDEGIFLVNRRQVDIQLEVSFDPCGGSLGVATRSYRLGASYGSLPVPVRDGYDFSGWFTAAEGGSRIAATDRAKSGVTRLYAQWSVYVDPFAPCICPGGGVVFRSNSESPWTVDHDEGALTPGAARSGAIGDSASTSLLASLPGPGTLAFRWKTSSEEGFDRLSLLVDGSDVGVEKSGESGWQPFTYEIAGPGPHTAEWRYRKDGSASCGSDCGWVDDVSFTPAP